MVLSILRFDVFIMIFLFNVILVIIYLDNSGKFRISYSYVIRFVSGYRMFVCLVINFIFVIVLNSNSIIFLFFVNGLKFQMIYFFFEIFIFNVYFQEQVSYFLMGQLQIIFIFIFNMQYLLLSAYSTCSSCGCIGNLGIFVLYFLYFIFSQMFYSQ